MPGIETYYGAKKLDNSKPYHFKEPKGFKKFLINLPQNGLLALTTVPFERRLLDVIDEQMMKTSPYSFPKQGSMLDKVKHLLQHPIEKSPSYLNWYKTQKIRLLKGCFSRGGYVLAGQCSRIFLIDQLGTGVLDLLKVAALQTCLYPFSVFSNSRQKEKTILESLKVVHQKSRYPTGYISFFGRNALAAYCYYPGILIKKHFSATYGENGATVSAIAVSLVISTAMNSFLKPFFTPGEASSLTRLAMAVKFPGGSAMCMREFVSVVIFFSSLMKTEK